MHPRNDEQMNGRLGVNVLYRYRYLILQHDFGSDLAVNDPAKDTVIHGTLSVVSGSGS
jgi:hypothetical protein